MAGATLTLAAALGFIGGVGAASFSLPFWTASGGAAAVGMLLAIRSRNAAIVLLILTAVMGGYLYHGFRIRLTDARLMLPEDGSGPYTALVVAETKPTARGIRIPVELDKPYAGRLDLFLEEWRDVRYGDRIRIEGDIVRRDPSRPPAIFADTIAIVSRENGNVVKQTLFDLKRRLVGAFERTLPTGSAALLAGITLGETGGMSREFRDAMSRSGTTHLTALSGYNILILIRTLERLLAGRLRRRTLVAATVATIALFVIMTGAEASVVRAAIMGTLLLVAGATGRTYRTMNAITLTATAMLLVDPRILRFDLGFQLSFLSLLGIIYLAPTLQALITPARTPDGEPRPGQGWRADLATTVAAQAAVAPLLITTFGEFSLTAVIANIAILELVPYLMGIGFALAGVALILPVLAPALALLAALPLAYCEAVIRLFADLRLPVTLPNFAVLVIPLYYASLLLLAAPERRIPSHATP